MKELKRLQKKLDKDNARYNESNSEYYNYVRENAERLFEGTFWKNTYSHQVTHYYFCKKVDRSQEQYYVGLPVYIVDNFSINITFETKGYIQSFVKSRKITNDISQFHKQIDRKEYERAFEIFKKQIGEFISIERVVLIEKATKPDIQDLPL